MSFLKKIWRRWKYNEQTKALKLQKKLARLVYESNYDNINAYLNRLSTKKRQMSYGRSHHQNIHVANLWYQIKYPDILWALVKNGFDMGPVAQTEKEKTNQNTLLEKNDSSIVSSVYPENLYLKAVKEKNNIVALEPIHDFVASSSAPSEKLLIGFAIEKHQHALLDSLLWLGADISQVEVFKDKTKKSKSVFETLIDKFCEDIQSEETLSAYIKTLDILRLRGQNLDGILNEYHENALLYMSYNMPYTSSNRHKETTLRYNNKLVSYFLSKGAQINQRFYESVHAPKNQINTGDINQKERPYQTAFSCACAHNNDGFVKELLNWPGHQNLTQMNEFLEQLSHSNYSIDNKYYVWLQERLIEIERRDLNLLVDKKDHTPHCPENLEQSLKIQLTPKEPKPASHLTQVVKSTGALNSLPKKTRSFKL